MSTEPRTPPYGDRKQSADPADPGGTEVAGADVGGAGQHRTSESGVGRADPDGARRARTSTGRAGAGRPRTRDRAGPPPGPPGRGPERMTSPGPGVLVAGVGNLFLGDDGFGPEVVTRLLRDGGPLPARPGWSTTASGACTWPTTCSTAATRWCSSTCCRAAGAPGDVAVLEVDRGRPRRRAGARRARHGPVRGARPPSGARRHAARRTWCWAAARVGGRGHRAEPRRSRPRSTAAVAACARLLAGPRAARAGRSLTMCLGIPGRVVEIVAGYAGQLALVDVTAPGAGSTSACSRGAGAGAVGADPHGLRGGGRSTRPRPPARCRAWS